MGNKVIAHGGTAEIHEGLLKGQKVRVKKLRVSSTDDPEEPKVRWSTYSWALISSDEPQLFYREAVVWKRIHHQNIVPFRGATLDPRQLVLQWMEYGSLTKFLEGHPNTNPFGLVCIIPTPKPRVLNLSPAKRRC